MKAILSVGVLAFLLGGLCVAGTATATTYYIDSVNGNDLNDGLSTATPVKTMTRGGALAGPGDTVYLRGNGNVSGHYNDPSRLARDCYIDNTWSGTSVNRVTVETYPADLTQGKPAIFDPGYSEFKTNPNTAWVPCTEPGAHPDEYISVNTYTMSGNDGAWGAFLNADGTAGTRLLTYNNVEDFRATQESVDIVAYTDPRAGTGYLTTDDPGTPEDETQMKLLWAYRGPGLWWDPATQKIHFRASATHWNQPGVTDYTGGTDPRNMSLSISLKGHYAFSVYTADYVTFKNIVIQNGGDSGGRIEGTAANFSERVTFDHCNFYPSRNGFSPVYVKFLTLSHCVFDGKLGSYVSRSDTKDSWDYYVSGHSGTIKTAGSCRMTQVCLLMNNTVNQDMDIDHCEFRNGHDGIQMWGYRPKLHHCLLENLNDEATMWYGYDAGENIQIYNNVFRKVMQAFSGGSGGGSWTCTNARWAYRNIVDQRVPILGYRQLPPDPLLTWRFGEEFKMSAPINKLYCYQNTFIVPPIGDTYAECSTFWSNVSATGQFQRRFINNVYMAIQTDRPLYTVPDPAYASYHLSDGNMWYRRKNILTTPLLKGYAGTTYNTWTDFRNSALWTSYFNANAVGWETNPTNPPSPIAYPQLANVQDYNPTDGGTYFNADYRLKSTSPARGVGVNLTTISWEGQTPPDTVAADATPDIGAVPYGASAVAVGVDSRFVFPDTTTPLAEAGDYTITSDTDQSGFESIAFTSTGSSDPDGTITGYNWTYNGSSISTASSFSKDLPFGTHDVYLTVTDNAGKTSKDMRQVTVTDPSMNDNIIRNPGFENGTTNWALTRAGPVVSSPTHYGAGAMKIVGQTLYCEAEQASIPVVANASMKFSGWIKTESVPAGKYAKMQLTFFDSGGVGVGATTYLPGVTGSTNWTYASATATVPATAATAKVKVMLDSGSTGGNAYYDDVRLMTTDNKVTNGFMERDMASTNWVSWQGAPSVYYDSTLSRSGTGAMRMIGVTGYHGVDQFIPVVEGQTYSVHAWVKTVNMPGTTKAWFEIRLCDANKVQKTYPYAGTLGGTSAYTKLSPAGGTIAIPTGQSITLMRLVLKIDSGATGGTAYFDDVYVK